MTLQEKQAAMRNRVNEEAQRHAERRERNELQKLRKREYMRSRRKALRKAKSDSRLRRYKTFVPDYIAEMVRNGELDVPLMGVSR